MVIKVFSRQNPVILNNNFLNIELYGSIVGSVISDELLTSQETLQHISKLKDFDSLENFLLKSIGSFFILIKSKNESRCYSSLVHNGFYFCKDSKDNVINISEEESDLISEDTKLKDQVLKRIGKVAPGLARFPLSSMFEGIERCPAGAYISHTNEIKTKNYLKKAFKDSNSDFDIKLSADLLERRLYLILKAYKEFYKDISLFMSGGIDSSVLLAVLKKYGLDAAHYFIPYSGEKSNNRKIAEYVTNHFQEELSIVEKDKLSKSEEKELLIKRCSSGPGSLMGAMYSGYYSRKNINPRTVITGQNLDSMYHIDTFAPNTEYTGIYRFLVLLKSSILRLRYTKINVVFQNLKSYLFNDPKIKSSQFDQTLNSDFEHVKSKVLENDHAYSKVKNKETLKLKKFLNLDDHFNLNLTSQNSYFKLIKFFRFVQNTYSNYYVLCKSEDILRVNPYGEGPILSILINYKLPLSSIFKIKTHSHILFKKLSGYHHNKLVKKALNYNLAEDLKRVIIYFYNKISKKDLKDKANLYNEIKLVYDDLLQHISLELINLELSDQIYIESLFDLIEKEMFIDEKKCDEILKVLGTLVYLTHIYKLKKYNIKNENFY